MAICSLIPKKLVMSYKHPARAYWDLFLFTLCLYSAFMIPLSFSFSLNFNFLNANKIIDITIDVAFTLDTVLMFLTSFRNKDG